MSWVAKKRQQQDETRAEQRHQEDLKRSLGLISVDELCLGIPRIVGFDFTRADASIMGGAIPFLLFILGTPTIQHNKVTSAQSTFRGLVLLPFFLLNLLIGRVKAKPTNSK